MIRFNPEPWAPRGRFTQPASHSHFRSLSSDLSYNSTTCASLTSSYLPSSSTDYSSLPCYSNTTSSPTVSSVTTHTTAVPPFSFSRGIYRYVAPSPSLESSPSNYLCSTFPAWHQTSHCKLFIFPYTQDSLYYFTWVYYTRNRIYFFQSSSMINL